MINALHKLEIRISGAKLARNSGALDGAMQKIGPRNGNLAGVRKNGAPEVWGPGVLA